MKIYPIHLRGLGTTVPLSIIGLFGVVAGVAEDNPATLGAFGVLAIPGLFLLTGILADILHPAEYYERDEHIFGGIVRTVGLLGLVGIAGSVLVVLNAATAGALFGHPPMRSLVRGAVTVGGPLVAGGLDVLSMVPMSFALAVVALSGVVMILTKLLSGPNLSEDVGLLLRGDLDRREDPVFER
ncbi:hypothetical protein [Halomarina rubra]|uniref:HPP family protein n=1 Tax=Halomarina rubra TaxID=2071873 RepID=A0ABD6AVB9_9EURY|nr:hypothetical protein [Halomarina rubra]